MLLTPGNNTKNQLTHDNGKSPLIKASVRGRVEIVQLLLAAKADPNLNKGYDKASPLYCAAYKGHIEVMKLLIEANADLDAPLVESGLVTMERDAKYETNYISNEMVGGCTTACIFAHNRESEPRPQMSPLKWCVDYICAKTCFRYYGTTPLHIASFFDQPEAIRVLIESGANTSSKTDHGKTPREVATSSACVTGFDCR